MKRTDYTDQIIQDRYHILRLLGGGGMGSVYLAQHKIIGKKVAIKFLHSELSDNPELVTRFYQEAQAAATIAHKNIIDVFDVGISNEGEPFLVMEFLEGESLEAMLERTGPISLAAACAIMEQVLPALDAAHQAGIIHRDLKPDNIFLVHRNGDIPLIKLIDFGISKTLSSNRPSITETGIFLGTPAYTSPEQIRGDKRLDHRTDIYSIGTILYQMLTGKLPFAAQSVNALLFSIIEDAPIPPKKAYHRFPSEAEDLIGRLLSKNPNRRPESALALLAELRTLDCFGDRIAHLTTYTASIQNVTFAAGHLGANLADSSDGMLAEEVLLSLAQNVTPTAWARTTSGRNITSNKKFLKYGIAVFGMLALVCTGIIIGMAHRSELVATTSTKETSHLNEPLGKNEVSSQKQVIVEIRGIPGNALVYLDNAPMSSHSFRVTYGEGPRSLRIHSEAHKDYLMDIVPNKDQLIIVTLEDVAAPATSLLPPSSEESNSSSKSKQNTASHAKRHSVDDIPAHSEKIEKPGSMRIIEDF